MWMDHHAGQVCNPTDSENLDHRIQRCVGGTQGVQCHVEGMLPSMKEVDKALMEQSYDTLPYSKSDEVKGFMQKCFRRLHNASGYRDRNVCKNFADGFRYTTECTYI